MQTILNQLKIKADVVKNCNNGVISKYYLRLHPGAKVSKIESCATEIALATKSYSKPFVRVIAEEGLVVIELLVNPLKLIQFSDFYDSFQKRLDEVPLPLILGQTHNGESLIPDFSIMPHLLIAGTTGSGKSISLHSIIHSLIGIDNVKLVLIDPKKVEFSYYTDINQLVYPVITEPSDALDILSDLLDEMNNRFKIMSKASVNTISDFNMKKPRRAFPYLILIIDEFSDLMYASKKVFQTKLSILAAKSRACGIHIILATQRPSVAVINGIIKANFPARISFKVSSHVDSRVILDFGGAERLLGKGDAIINSVGYSMVRFQGAYLGVNEIKQRCDLHKRSKWSKVINSLRGVK